MTTKNKQKVVNEDWIKLIDQYGGVKEFCAKTRFSEGTVQKWYYPPHSTPIKGMYGIVVAALNCGYGSKKNVIDFTYRADWIDVFLNCAKLGRVFFGYDSSRFVLDGHVNAELTAPNEDECKKKIIERYNAE